MLNFHFCRVNEILFLVIFVLLIGTALIAHFKRKDLIKTRKNRVSQNLNANPALVKQFQVLIIAVCSLISYLPWIFQVYKIESKVIWYVLTNIQTQIVTGLVSPFLFYVFNAKLRKHCVDQFWNFSPDWFYKLRPFNLNSQIENAAKDEMNDTSISVIYCSKLFFETMPSKSKFKSLSSLSSLDESIIPHTSRRSSF